MSYVLAFAAVFGALAVIDFLAWRDRRTKPPTSEPCPHIGNQRTAMGGGWTVATCPNCGDISPLFRARDDAEARVVLRGWRHDCTPQETTTGGPS